MIYEVEFLVHTVAFSDFFWREEELCSPPPLSFFRMRQVVWRDATGRVAHRSMSHSRDLEYIKRRDRESFDGSAHVLALHAGQNEGGPRT